jgi:hypothetical protein
LILGQCPLAGALQIPNEILERLQSSTIPAALRGRLRRLVQSIAALRHG